MNKLLWFMRGRHHHKHPQTRFLRIVFHRQSHWLNHPGEHNMNSVSLLVGQKVTASLQPVDANGVVVTGATLSEIVWANGDVTKIILTDNENGTALLVADAAGSLTITASATVTDPNGAVTALITTASI